MSLKSRFNRISIIVIWLMQPSSQLV
ncbi:MAG: DUF4044 domain-containing protein [Nitrospira sp.]|nr:DUF4044 domain-containing protein [Nitrospira sp.]